MLDWESNIRIETVYISSVTFQLRFVKETGPILRVTETWAWTFLGNKTEMLKNPKNSPPKETNTGIFPPQTQNTHPHISFQGATWAPTWWLDILTTITTRPFFQTCSSRYIKIYPNHPTMLRHGTLSFVVKYPTRNSIKTTAQDQRFTVRSKRFL